MRTVFVFLLIFLHANAFASVSDSLIREIRSFQIKKSNEYYSSGLFPSGRIHAATFYERPDNNIFFSAIIVYTLQKHYQKLTPYQRLITDSIASDVRRNYGSYANKDGGITYNFWQTNPIRQFPNDPVLSRQKSLFIPDDADDAVMIYMTSNLEKNKAVALKDILIKNAAVTDGICRSCMPEYRHLHAYSTWTGSKMPVEWDICVQSNILLFGEFFGLDIQKEDTETEAWMCTAIKKGWVAKYPGFISPQYKSSAAIYYHLSRLLSSSERYSELKKYIPELREQTYKAFTKSGNEVERVMLASSLIRLGMPVNFRPDTKKFRSDMKDFRFFYANMGSVAWYPFNRMLSGFKMISYEYRCDAWALTLWLEYELLKLS